MLYLTSKTNFKQIIMGFGLGTVNDMIKGFNRNRSQLNLGKDRVAHVKQQYKNVLYHSGKLNIREIPLDELNKIKTAIKNEKEKTCYDTSLYFCCYCNCSVDRFFSFVGYSEFFQNYMAY